jgi:hypothetical protein
MLLVLLLIAMQSQIKKKKEKCVLFVQCELFLKKIYAHLLHGRSACLLLLLATKLRISSFLLVALCLDYNVFLLLCFFSVLVCILCDV